MCKRFTIVIYNSESACNDMLIIQDDGLTDRIKNNKTVDKFKIRFL